MCSFGFPPEQLSPSRVSLLNTDGMAARVDMPLEKKGMKNLEKIRNANGCKLVKVTNEGDVVPGLMTTDAVFHNGCTTSVEAYVMGVPTISYRPKINEGYAYLQTFFKLRILIQLLQGFIWLKIENVYSMIHID